MPNIQYHTSYDKFKSNQYVINASNDSSIHIRNACFNNDRLLKLHKLSFAEQIRIMAAKGINLNRRVYEHLRKGTAQTISYNWLSYLAEFWRDNYGYTFTSWDMQNPEFNQMVSEPLEKYGK